jgi:formate-dependent nitrite reductase membrane component NrfD
MSTITASTGVETTYYGKPVVKAPHWRWLIITYFFCGGIAGAGFTIGTIANLVSRDRSLERAARYLAWVALIPCPLLLILDLGRPGRFLNMLRIVKLKSPMSLGSWALSGFGVFATLAAALHLLADITGRDRYPGLRRLIGILGLPFSIFLSGYTGLLLAATNIPIWWRSFPLLTPTFISSAYSTALAGISLILARAPQPAPAPQRRLPWSGRRQSPLDAPRPGSTGQRLARAESICLAVEITFLTAIVVRLGKIGRPLTSGRLGLIFWPVTYIGGLLVPLALQLNGPVQGRSDSVTRRRVAALLSLAGGFSLRALMIFAGRESARRPEDYFAMTARTSER